MRFRDWTVCLLVFLATCCVSSGAWIIRRPVSAASPTYLIKQGFEGTGYDNSESWTTSAGDPDPDSTANPYEGTQSLDIDSTLDVALSPAFTAQSECWAYFTLYLTTRPLANRTVFRFQSADGASTAAYVDMTNTGQVRLFHSSGGSATNTSLVASDATRYHIWLHFVKGTGSNGVLEFWHATTDTKPGSTTGSITNGVGTIDTGRVMLGNNGATQGMVGNFDKIRVDDVAIGSAPE